MGNTIQEDYREAVGVINTFIDEPPLTIGEHRTLYHLVEAAHRNNERVEGRECLVSCPSAEAMERYFLQYGISLPEAAGFVRHHRNAFKEYFNRIRRECILP